MLWDELANSLFHNAYAFADFFATDWRQCVITSLDGALAPDSVAFLIGAFQIR
jgi:hypothetical protein